MAVKVSLTDRISIEGGGTIVDEQRFPGRQGRFVFAYLLAARGRPVPREQLADALWDGAPPATWKEALSVLTEQASGPPQRVWSRRLRSADERLRLLPVRPARRQLG